MCIVAFIVWLFGEYSDYWFVWGFTGPGASSTPYPIESLLRTLKVLVEVA